MPARELVSVALQRLREPRNWSHASASSFGFAHTESTGVLTRERLAVAIGDRAAMRGDLRDAREARVPCSRGSSWSTSCRSTARHASAERAARQQRRAAKFARQRKLLGVVARAALPSSTAARLMALSRNMLSWRDQLDLRRRRHRHLELRARHALDERVRRPGALLELQLAPLDFELVAPALSRSSSTNSSRARCFE